MKRKIFVTAILLFMLVFAACGGNSDNAAAAEATPTPPVEIARIETPPTEEPAALPGLPFYSEDVVVGVGGGWALPALLTVPPGASADEPVPAVVLVHGSGASNMDNAVGDVRPFYDIADYLSRNGIAVLRYDKRNYVYAIVDYGAFTVFEETVEDAVLAAELLLADERIDSDRIYLVGLSLGAILAPRIQTTAQDAGFEFAGLVLMAGTPREASETMVAQLNDSLEAAIHYRLPLLEGDELALAKAEIAAAVEQIAFFEEVAAMIFDTPAEEAQGMFFLGGSFYYFQDLASPSFEESANKITTPMLVLQGGRDFQVRADLDFILLQEILGGRDNVTFKLYDDLNHLFMESTATNFVEHAIEIMTSDGRVDVGVLRDIVEWIVG